ncbi:hypothetical protein ISCGN_018844 [Ixodes scapularis]
MRKGVGSVAPLVRSGGGDDTSGLRYADLKCRLCRSCHEGAPVKAGVWRVASPRTPSPAGGACTLGARCLVSSVTTDPSHVGHHTRTQGAPTLRGSFAEAVSSRGPAPSKVSVATQVSLGNPGKPLQSSTPRLKLSLPGHSLSAAKAAEAPGHSKNSGAIEAMEVLVTRTSQSRPEVCSLPCMANVFKDMCRYFSHQMAANQELVFVLGHQEQVFSRSWWQEPANHCQKFALCRAWQVFSRICAGIFRSKWLPIRNSCLFPTTKSKYFQGLGCKNQPIKARRSLFFAAHGKCFQVSTAHKPAGASSFSFKVSTAYKQASTSSFFLKGGTCESRCLESGVSTDPEPCGYARPRLAVRGFPVSGEQGILVVEPSPGRNVRRGGRQGTRSLSKASVGTQYSLRDTECPPSPLTPTETSVRSQTPEAPQKLTKSKAFPQRLAPKVRVVLDPTRSQVRNGSPSSSTQGVEEATEVNVSLTEPLPPTEGSMETATPGPSCSKAGSVSSAPLK